MNNKVDIQRIFSEDLYNNIDPEHEQHFENFFEQIRPLIDPGNLMFYNDFSNDVQYSYGQELEMLTHLSIDLNSLTKGKILNFQSLVDRKLNRNNENNSLILSQFFNNETSYLYNFVSALLYILFKELKELSPNYYENLDHG